MHGILSLQKCLERIEFMNEFIFEDKVNTMDRKIVRKTRFGG